MDSIKAYDTDSINSSNNGSDIEEEEEEDLNIQANKRQNQEDNPNPNPIKKPRLPPLPSSIQDISFKSLNAHKPLPSSANRHFNMNTRTTTSITRPLKQLYASLEFTPTEHQCQQLDYLLESVNFLLKHSTGRYKSDLKAMSLFQPVYKSPLKYSMPLHVSLSHNYSIPLQKTAQAVDDLRRAISQFNPAQKGLNLVDLKSLRCDSIQVYPNSNWSASFLTLRLSTSTRDNLSLLTSLIRSTITESVGADDLKVLDIFEWDDQRLHITIAESPTFYNDKIMSELVKEISESLDFAEFEKDLSWKFEDVKIRYGENTRSSVTLGG
ncbi:hypothetical protein WICPIJ_001427 [Wickerhamomyces pijperi]|uniref:U6 snRNA phosphodiesterase n=1 Tax=Wickerhamomyces pijperi TaxID=599730 RepID=A0A9P8QAV2_WICPI|nr:hypothetical protein WICPIJ_001427 [Wickerhamomyces pijperi]